MFLRQMKNSYLLLNCDILGLVSCLTDHWLVNYSWRAFSTFGPQIAEKIEVRIMSVLLGDLNIKKLFYKNVFKN